MRYWQVAFLLAAATPSYADAACSRFPDANSTAFNPDTSAISLPWRTDLPTAPGSGSYAWEAVDPTQDWQGYMTAFLDEMKGSGLAIQAGKITMSATANWWIAPWMDFSPNGREPLLGLTKERGPDANDLAPGSSGGRQVWAVGFYNREGAFALGQVFADPCNPKVPAPVAGVPWTFPNRTASFKLLFTDAAGTEVPYLAGSPEVEAMIGRPVPGSTVPTRRKLRLIQIDIAVRDTRAEHTHWVMGTFIWKGPRTGDGLFDNFVPVGLMWGNDPAQENPAWAGFATLAETKLNPDLAGVVWQGAPGSWPQRPYPGHQGRLNGPADNLRSSCLSCHGLAQWPRHPRLGIVPRYSLDPLPSAAELTAMRKDYFRNVMGGTLSDPSVAAVSLDYSLQLEAAFSRMCEACSKQKMTGATPTLCNAPQRWQVTRATCERGTLDRIISGLSHMFSGSEPPEADDPPRQ